MREFPMTGPRLQVIVGATRPGRIGPQVARWFLGVAADHPSFDLELVDLAEVNLPMLDEPENPARGGVFQHEHSRAWSRSVAGADAFVFVIPEYNNGYNAAVKNALDYLYYEWHDKAVGFVSYGGNMGGGTRAVQALKPVMLALRAVPVHEAVSIPFIYSTLDERGRFQGTPGLARAAADMLAEIARRERALRQLRGPREDPAGLLELDGTVTS
jgi:NAD(P)H-dependent FMN reductase